MSTRYSVGKGPLVKPTMANKLIHLLVPDIVSEGRNKDEQLTHNSDKEDYINELKQLAAELHLTAIVHRLIMTNITSSIDKIPIDDLIMNLCDGSDLDGVPGPSVAAYLEEKKYLNVVGCDSLFINNTLTKNGMKKIFVEHHIPSPPGFPATKDTDLDALVEDSGLVFPLFVKLSDSYGSVGLDDDSVCHDMQHLKQKCEKLFRDFPSLTIEEFIEGPEFSVLVSGNCRDPSQNVIVYPPAERAFNKDLGKYQKFISFTRNWDAAALAHDYAVVEDANDYNALQDISRRAYTAVSGNCYGRDIRKRDVNGKFYVLEVNASCGLGKGSSSEFILKLAGQTTKDFFEILLSEALKSGGAVPETELTQEPEQMDTEDGDTASILSVIPAAVEEKVAKMIKHPSLAIMPTPVVHVIVAGVLIDPETGIPDPEGKLVQAWGKDAEYVSELEGIFRNIGFDPIVHLYLVDAIDEILGKLDSNSDLIFNACLGHDGLQVANLVEKYHFKHSVGLNARFFKESRDRSEMKSLLRQSKLQTPPSFVFRPAVHKVDQIEEMLSNSDITFPVYCKPVVARMQPHAIHSGQKVTDVDQLKMRLKTLGHNEEALIEQFMNGKEYRVLVAGDARDPNADVIVFPPVCNQSSVAESKNDALFIKELGSAKSLVNNPETYCYRPMNQNELMLQMDLQDLARRAYVAVHGSCYGIVTVVDHRPTETKPLDSLEVYPVQYGGNQLHVINVSGDVRFGENAKAGIVLELANLKAEALFAWLLKRSQ